MLETSIVRKLARCRLCAAEMCKSAATAQHAVISEFDETGSERTEEDGNVRIKLSATVFPGATV